MKLEAAASAVELCVGVVVCLNGSYDDDLYKHLTDPLQLNTMQNRVILTQCQSHAQYTWSSIDDSLVGQLTSGEISSDLDRTKKMTENLNIIQMSHFTFDCS